MRNIAEANFQALGANPYPGRGIVIGRNSTNTAIIQIYWIMGRSDNSRNRVFSFEGERIFTEAADPSKVKDPSLIIYNAADRYGQHFVVSNGAQTDTVIKALKRCVQPDKSLNTEIYEPDEPNYTPRITGILCKDDVKTVQFNMIRKSSLSKDCERFDYRYKRIGPGFGFCITTYQGDGDPLPSFRGEPLPVPIGTSAEEIAQAYWNNLNEANRVSLAVKMIPDDSDTSVIKIINKYKKL